MLVQRVGTAAELAARAADAALAQREAHGAAARVVARRTAAGGVLGAAREHGGAGRYGLASTMLTLELMQIDRVVEEWRHLVSGAFPSRTTSILTDICRCHACSCHEIEDGDARAGATGARAAGCGGQLAL
eukprot:COSAG01_NODE_108_length_25947_cov_25.489593_13_plen_131_part_00